MENVVINICRLGHQWVEDTIGPICPDCGSRPRKSKYTSFKDLCKRTTRGKPHFQIGVFKPFIDEHTTKTPVKIETREQRDKFCKDNNITYDKYTNLRPIDRLPAIDSIDFGDVKKAVEEGGARDCELEYPDFDEETNARRNN